MNAKKFLRGLMAAGIFASTLTFTPQVDNLIQNTVTYASEIDESYYPDDIPIVRSDDVSKYSPPIEHYPMPDKYIRMYDEAIAKSPNDATLYCSRGMYLRVQNKYEQAIADFNKAMSLEPKFFHAYFQRAETYRIMQDYKRAVRDYTLAIACKRTSPTYYIVAHKHRIFAYEKLGNYDRAIKEYDKLLRYFPDAEVYWARQAELYAETGQYDKAIKNYTMWIELEPERAEPYGERAAMYAMQQDYQSAISDLSTAIELEPDNASFYLARGIFYKILDDDKNAEADFAKAKELDYEE